MKKMRKYLSMLLCIMMLFSSLDGLPEALAAASTEAPSESAPLTEPAPDPGLKIEVQPPQEGLGSGNTTTNGDNGTGEPVPASSTSLQGSENPPAETQGSENPPAEPQGDTPVENGPQVDTPEEVPQPDEDEPTEVAFAAQIAGPLSAFVGEDATATVTISGGTAPYTVYWEPVAGGASTVDGPFTVDEQAMTYTFRPSAFGTMTLKVLVLDANKEEQRAEITIAVAERVVEHEDEWLGALADAGFTQTGDWRQDLLAVAMTQRGIAESERNFIIDGSGTHGYTRYGALQGRPYESWNAMFVDFVAKYAGLDANYFPQSATTAKEIADALRQVADAAVDANHQPQPGDLAFLYRGGAQNPEFVGIVSSVYVDAEGTPKIDIIMGDVDNAVSVVAYNIGAEEIVGYGDLARVIQKYADDEAAKQAAQDQQGQQGGEQTSAPTETVKPTDPPVKYYCGKTEHVHNQDCYIVGEGTDENGNPNLILNCGLEEHTHTEECTKVPMIGETTPTEPEPTDTAEPTEPGETTPTEPSETTPTEPQPSEPEEQPESEYICGMVEHTHDDSCYAWVESEEGQYIEATGKTMSKQLICGLPEHTHTDACLPAAAPEGGDQGGEEQPEEPEKTYYCGLEEHTHTEACYDAEGNLICEVPEHTHTAECEVAPEEEPEKTYYCGLEEHTHTEACYDAEGNLICEVPEHTHTAECEVAPAEEPEPEYICGKEEHTHTEACYDAEGNLICEIEEHTHDENCVFDAFELRETIQSEAAAVLAAAAEATPETPVAELIGYYNKLNELYDLVGDAYAAGEISEAEHTYLRGLIAEQVAQLMELFKGIGYAPDVTIDVDADFAYDDENMHMTVNMKGTAEMRALAEEINPNAKPVMVLTFEGEDGETYTSMQEYIAANGPTSGIDYMASMHFEFSLDGLELDMTGAQMTITVLPTDELIEALTAGYSNVQQYRDAQAENEIAPIVGHTEEMPAVSSDVTITETPSYPDELEILMDKVEGEEAVESATQGEIMTIGGQSASAPLANAPATFAGAPGFGVPIARVPGTGDEATEGDETESEGEEEGEGQSQGELAYIPVDPDTNQMQSGMMTFNLLGSNGDGEQEVLGGELVDLGEGNKGATFQLMYTFKDVTLELGTSSNPTYTLEHYVLYKQVAMSNRLPSDFKVENGAVTKTISDQSVDTPTNNGGLTRANVYLVGSDTSRTFQTVDVYHRLFWDETGVQYMDKPGIPQMDRLYNSRNDTNNAYTLSEVWVKKGKMAEGDDKSVMRFIMPADDPEAITFINYKSSLKNFYNKEITAGSFDVGANGYSSAYPLMVKLEKDMTVRLVFKAKPNQEKFRTAAKFYDYDISDRHYYTSNAKADPKLASTYQKGMTGKWIITSNEGINKANAATTPAGKTTYAFGNKNFSNYGQKVASVGNRNCTINQATYEADGKTKINLGGEAYGIVTGMSGSNLTNAVPTFASTVWGDPRLFNDAAMDGKHVEGATNLVFNREGGVYTLFNVEGDVSNARNLDTFRYSTKQYQPDGNGPKIYTNDFWPLDGKKATAQDERDIPVGKDGNRAVGRDGTEWDVPMEDGNDKHNRNAYFGMKTQLKFTMDSGYAGPLDYFFFGDDDMWVVLAKTDENGNVSGETDLICDIGGVHTSVGAYVNLWATPLMTKWFPKGYVPYEDDPNEIKTYNFSLFIFYTERGASGSTCYMRCTLPLESVPTTNKNYSSMTIEKKIAYNEDLPDDEKKALEDALNNTDFRFKFHAWNGAGELLDSVDVAVPVEFHGTNNNVNGEPDDGLGWIKVGSEFTLKPGEWVKFPRMPVGWRYSVEELTFYDGSVDNPYFRVEFEVEGDVSYESTANGVEYKNNDSGKDPVFTFRNDYTYAPYTFAPSLSKALKVYEKQDDPEAAKKEIDGDLTWLSDHTYTFKLSLEPAKTLEANNGKDYSKYVEFGKDAVAGEQAATQDVVIVDGKPVDLAKFDDITFKHVGTYVFLLEELDPGDSSTIDANKWLVTVNIGIERAVLNDDNKTSSWTVRLKLNSITYEKVNPVESDVVQTNPEFVVPFENELNVERTHYSPRVLKSFLGGEPDDTDVFTFTMEDLDPTGNHYLDAIEYPPQQGAQKGQLITELTGKWWKSHRNWTKALGTLWFKRGGVFEFRITEKQTVPAVPDKDHLCANDPHTWTLTVWVNEYNGKLTVDLVEYKDDETGEKQTIRLAKRADAPDDLDWEYDPNNEPAKNIGGAAAEFTNLYGKKIEGADEHDIQSGAKVKVGQEITYRIPWYNPYNYATTVTITDKLDDGVDYVTNSANPTAMYNGDTRTLTWTINATAKGEDGSWGEVSFHVTVNETAVRDVTEFEDGRVHDLENRAHIEVGDIDHHSSYVVDTNEVHNDVEEPHKTEVTPGDGKLVKLDDVITYRITWRNYFAADDEKYPGGIADIVITDQNDRGLDEGVEFVEAYFELPGADEGTKDETKPTLTAGNSAVEDEDGTYSIQYTADKQVIWTLKGMGPKTAGAVILKVQVKEEAYTPTDEEQTNGDLDVPHVYNQADVKVGNEPAVETERVKNPLSEREKTSGTENDIKGIGEKIIYFIDWQNYKDQENNAPATVIITDTLDQGVNFVEAGFVEGNYTKEQLNEIKTVEDLATLKTSTGDSDRTITGPDNEIGGTVKWTLYNRPYATKGWVYLVVEVSERATTVEVVDEDGHVVKNQAKVKVGNDDDVETNVVKNPVPEKKELEGAEVPVGGENFYSPGDGNFAKVDDSIVYEITWRNNYDAEATVTITDTLDEGVEFLAADHNGAYDTTSRTVTWKFQAASKTEGTVVLAVRVTEAALTLENTGIYDKMPGHEDKNIADVENQAFVQVGEGPVIGTSIPRNPVPEKTETGVYEVVDDVTGKKYTLTPEDFEDKTLDNKAVKVGQVLEYKITWENTTGENPVTVVDTYDSNVEIVKIDPAGVDDPANRTITWTFNDTKKGDSGTVWLWVKVLEGAAVGDGVTNNAKVENGSDVKELPPVENPVPEKEEVTPGDGKYVDVGEEITYQIHWQNTYDYPASLTIDDELDPGVVFVDASVGYWAEIGKTLNTTEYNMQGEISGVEVGGNGTVHWELYTDAAAKTVPANSYGYVVLTVRVTEAAKALGDGDYAGSEENDHALNVEDGIAEVVNDAKVTVDNNAQWTNKVENPVPEKGITDITPDSDRKENNVTDPSIYEVEGDHGEIKTKLANLPVLPGDQITYQITWKNTADEAVKVEITDKLDPNVGFVSAGFARTYNVTLDKIGDALTTDSKASINFDGETVTWTINAAEAKEGGIVTLTVVVLDSAYVDGVENGAEIKVGNDGTYDGATLPEVEDESPAKIEAKDKTDEHGEQLGDVQVGEGDSFTSPGDGNMVQVGETIVYNIHWQNTEDEPAEVIITDVLDKGVDFVAADMGTTTDAEGAKSGHDVWLTADAQSGDGIAYDDGTRTVSWTFTAPANSYGYVSLAVRVNEKGAVLNSDADNYDAMPGHKDTKDGDVENQAHVKVGNNPVVDTEVKRNPVPTKSLTEKVTDGVTFTGELGTTEFNDKPVKAGDELTYQISWENDGDVEAKVTVTDVLDKDVEFVKAEPEANAEYDDESRTVTWTFANIQPGDGGIVTLTVKVKGSAIVPDGVKNGATIQIGDNDEHTLTPVENPEPKKEEVEGEITDAEGNTFTSPGDGNDAVVGSHIVYKITWQNTFEEEAEVTVTDILDEGVDFVEATNGYWAKISDDVREEIEAKDEVEAAKPEYDEVTRTVTWKLGKQPANSFGYVELVVQVNEKGAEPNSDAHYDGADSETGIGTKDTTTGDVENQAHVKVGNNESDTDVKRNPVPKKQVTGITSTTHEVYNTTDADGNSTFENVQVRPEDVITYKITWDNTNGAAGLITITDPLDSAVEFVSAKSGEVELLAGDTEAGNEAATLITFDLDETGATSGTVTWKINAAEGEQGVVELTVQVRKGVHVDGVHNDATITNVAGIETPVPEVENPKPEKEEIAGESDIVVDGENLDSPGNGNNTQPGETIVYRITWQNTYNEARIVTVRDQLDVGVDYITATNGMRGKIPQSVKDAPEATTPVEAGEPAYNKDTRTVTWNLGEQPANSFGYVELAVLVNKTALKLNSDAHYDGTDGEPGVGTADVTDGDVENQASVQLGNDPEVFTDVMRNPVQQKDIVEVTGSVTYSGTLGDTEYHDKPVAVGDKITYQISWENTKTETEKAKVTVVDTLDPDAKFESAGWVDIRGVSVNYDADNHTVTWDLGEQPAGASGIVYVTISVLENAVKNGEHNDASIQIGDEPAFELNPVENPVPKKEEAEGDVTVGQAEDGSDETFASPGDGKYTQVGKTIVYRIRWQNTYDQPATLTIDDPLDEGVDFIKATNGFIGTIGDGKDEPDQPAPGTEPVYENGNVHWTLGTSGNDGKYRVDANTYGYVLLVVKVNDKALKIEPNEDIAEVVNTATVTVNDNAMPTNEVENPLAQKDVTGIIPGPQGGEQHDYVMGENTAENIPVRPGDVIRYTISWKNTSESAQTVTITDRLDDNVAYVRSYPVGTYHERNDENADLQHSVVWTIDAAGKQDGQVNLWVRVLDREYEDENGAIDGNEKAVNGANIQVGVGNVYDATAVPDVENPVPEKIETVPGDNEVVVVGDEITYRIYWANTYDEPADVVIEDTLDVGVDYVRATFDFQQNSSELDKYDEYDLDDAATVQVGGKNTPKITWSFTAKANTKGYVELTVKVTERALTKLLDSRYDAAGRDGDDVIADVQNEAIVTINGNSVTTDRVRNPVPEKAETEIIDPVTGKVASAPLGETDPVEWLNDKTVVPGQILTYEISWENAADVAQTITVVDKLPEGAKYVEDSVSEPGVYDATTHTVRWVFENAQPGDRGTVTVQVEVLRSALKYDYLKNEAWLEIGDGPEKQKKPIPEVENPLPGKVETDPGDGKMVLTGDTITYRIYWQNTEETAVNIKIEDFLDGGVDYIVGSDKAMYQIVGEAEKPVEDVQFEFTDHEMDESGKLVEKAGTLYWEFMADANSSGYVELQVLVTERALKQSDAKYDGNPEDDTVADVENQARVDINNSGWVDTDIMRNPIPQKLVSGVKDPITGEVLVWEGIQDDKLENLPVCPGDPIEYTITWENSLDDVADVTITDVLDKDVTFASSDTEYTLGEYVDEDGTVHETVTWVLKDQPAGANGQVKLTVTVLESAIVDGVTNDATVSVKNDGDDDEKTVPEVENPVPEKTEDDPGDGKMVLVGDTITYRIYWQNTYDEAATVQIVDTLDSCVAYVEGSASDEGAYNAENHTVEWSFTAEANSEGSVTFDVTVLPSALTDADAKYDGNPEDDVIADVENQASVKVGDGPWIDTNIPRNPIPQKGITEIDPVTGQTVTATLPEHDKLENVPVKPGDEITYTIPWENTRDGVGTVTVIDKLDVDVEFVEASHGYALSSEEQGDGTSVTVVTWTFENVPAKERGQVTVTVRVLESAYVDGVTNEATVRVSNGDEVYDEKTPPEVENPSPEKKEVKPGDGVMVDVGEHITYNIYWQNTYNEAADVVINDILDTGVNFVTAGFDDIEAAKYNGTAIVNPVSVGTPPVVDENGNAVETEDVPHTTVTWTFHAAANSEGYVTLEVEVTERALRLADDNYDPDGAEAIPDVENQASVKVGDGPEIWTDIPRNPLPVKSEVTPGRDEMVQVGDEITYSITWQNGHDEAATVTITDELDHGVNFVSADNGGSYDSATHTVTWVLPDRAAMASGAVQLVVEVNEYATLLVDPDSKYDAEGETHADVENQASVQVGNDPAVDTEIIPNPVPDPEKEIVNIQPVTGTGARRVEPNAEDNFNGVTALVGETLEYEITWWNYRKDANGEPIEAEVTVSDTLDEKLTFVSASYGEGDSLVRITAGSPESAGDELPKLSYDANSRTVKWTFMAGADETGTVTLRARVNDRALDGAAIPNQGAVAVDGDAAIDTNIVETPTPELHKSEPGLSSPSGREIEEKDDYDGTTVLVGETITYRIDWKNYKNVPATVVIKDGELDKGLTYVDGSASDGGTYDSATRTITWDLGEQPAQQSGFVTFQATVNENATPQGQVVNQARMSVDNEAEVKTNVVENPTPKPEKVETDPGEGEWVLPGQLVTYVITWRNYKSTEAEVFVRDPLDRNAADHRVDFVSADNGGVYDAATHTVNWSLGRQPAGAEGRVTLVVRVTTNATPAGEIWNTAYVRVDNDSEVKTDDIWNPTPNPSKTEDDPGANVPVLVGATITYRINWRNYQDQPADVIIRDPLDVGLDYVAGSASDGGTYDAATRSVRWVLRQMPSQSAGSVTFRATVNDTALVAGFVRNYAYVQVGDDPEVQVGPVDNPVNETPPPPPPGEPEPATTMLDGRKIWVDNDDAAGVRPDAITVVLYANGVAQPNVPEWTIDGNTWYYVFRNLPEVDENEQPITYTVGEVQVEYYETTQTGTTITNTLLPPEIRYTSVNGLKIWNDNDNAAGLRPDSITVRLYRDGVEIDQTTVTAANNWRYTFGNLPVNDGYDGAPYVYTVSEDPVENYYQIQDGFNFLNGLIPGRDPDTPVPFDGILINDLGVPLFGMPTEEELEDLIELFDYDTPLWGGLMKTGDEMPVYPFVFGGMGALIVAFLLFFDRKKRKAKG